MHTRMYRPSLNICSFCPTDQKFASCSDDGTVRIWDFVRYYEEKILRGKIDGLSNLYRWCFDTVQHFRNLLELVVLLLVVKIVFTVKI